MISRKKTYFKHHRLHPVQFKVEITIIDRSNQVMKIHNRSIVKTKNHYRYFCIFNKQNN